MFTNGDLIKDLDRMKAHWMKRMENPGPLWAWCILDNLRRIDGFNIDRTLGTVYVRECYSSSLPIIEVCYPIQTFVLGFYKHIAHDEIQNYKASKPMRPLRAHAWIGSSFKSGDSESPDRRFLHLEYSFAANTSLEDMTQAMKGVVETDLSAIEYNTKLLVEDMNDWLDINLRDIVSRVEAEKQVVYEDPLEKLATHLAGELGLIRARVWAKD